MSLLKASINIWNEDISSDADDRNMWSEFEHDLVVAKSFAILDCAKSILLNSELPTRKLSEHQVANYMFKVNSGNTRNKV